MPLCKNDYNVLICFEWVKRTGEVCIQSEMLYCCILSSLFLIPKVTLKNFNAETRVGRLLSGEALNSVTVTQGGFFFFLFQWDKKTKEVILLLVLSNAPMIMRIYAASGSVVGNYLLF